MKGRLKGAQTGHRLLKKKADALQLKFRSILKKIIETKQLMGEVMKEASFSLAETKFASGGDLNQVRICVIFAKESLLKSQAVLQNVNKAQIKVKTKNDNVAGVNLPVFESYQVACKIKEMFVTLYNSFQDGGDAYELAGLAKGGQQLKRLKANYQKAINLLVELASLQTSFITLDEVMIANTSFK